MDQASTGSLHVAMGIGLQVGVLLGLAGCGGNPETIDPTESNVVVNVGNVPPRTATLSVKATLDGKAAMSPVDLDMQFTRFGFSLPYSTSGRLVLEATSYDSDKCTHGVGQGQTDLPNPLVEVPLPLAVQSPRKCEPFTPCAAGAVCPEPTKPTTNVLYGMFALSPTDIWAVGGAGTTIHYDGTSWQTVPVPAAYSTRYLNAVWASGPNDVWAVGQQGLILRWNGSSWANSSNANTYDYNGVWGFASNNVWACGSANICYRYNGTSWVDVSPIGPTEKMYGVWGSSPTDIWVAAELGKIFRYTGIWTQMSAPGTTTDLRFVWGRSASQVFMVGGNETILRWDGSIWRRVRNSATGVNLNAIMGDDSAMYAVGNNGTFLQSLTPPFDTWTANNSGVSSGLYGLTLGPQGVGWMVGSAGFLGHYDRRP